MPRLSDSMEEGTILKWLRGSGDRVGRGDELVEIETDKANMTYEAEAEGVLAIVAKEGETLPVGALIARLADAPVDGAAEPPQAGGASQPVAGVPAERPVAASEPMPVAEPVPPAQPSDAPQRVPDADRDSAEGAPAGRPKASPVARRMARELGVELGDVPGSGPGGRVVKSDVAAAAGAASPARAGTAKGDVTVQEPTRLQQTVARRMAESKATAPDFVLHVDVAMDAAVALREELKDSDGPTPSYNDLVVKAAAGALRDFPRANAAYRDGRFELYSRVNVGVAVASDDALVVPVVFDADTKPLARIAAETRSLAERVRSGVITPPELSGGTFTVSNLGMYGMGRIVPVINPPQAAILGVGAIDERPVVRAGAVVPGHVMPLTLVCDHRILYGADAAAFLARIRERLERPLGLVLEAAAR